MAIQLLIEYFCKEYKSTVSKAAKRSSRLRIENCQFCLETRKSVLLSLPIAISVKQWGRSQISVGSGMKEGGEMERASVGDTLWGPKLIKSFY